VFGPLLLVALQLFGQPDVFLGGAAARPRSGNRVRFDARAFDPHQHLGRRAHHRNAAHADEIHVRRGVDVPQRPIDGERIGGHLGFEPLRQHHLIHVARRDVFLPLADLFLELLARVVRPHVERRRLVGPRRHREIAFELAFEELDLGAGELVQRLEVVVGPDARVGDDQDPVLDVIESEHRVEQHEAGLVGAVAAVAKIAEHRLEPRGGTVAQVADGAPGEAREIWNEGRAEVGHQPAQRLDERAIALRHHAAALQRQAAVVRAQDQERILSQEGVPAHVLASFDAFEEERVVGVLGDLQERRDRRQQIGDDFLAHGHERAAARQLLEFLK
jgi:hypothetical protein